MTHFRRMRRVCTVLGLHTVRPNVGELLQPPGGHCSAQSISRSCLGAFSGVCQLCRAASPLNDSGRPQCAAQLDFFFFFFLVCFCFFCCFQHRGDAPRAAAAAGAVVLCGGARCRSFTAGSSRCARAAAGGRWTERGCLCPHRRHHQRCLDKCAVQWRRPENPSL